MRNMKRVLSMILVVALTLSLCLPIVHAEDNSIKVMLNGTYVDFDVEPQLINDRTMVPFRAIFEAMGATVQWDQDLWQATGEKDGKKVSMIIDSTEVVVTNNGEEKIISIDQAPTLVDGRTLVPVRFVAQAFDKIVAWDNDERTVIIFDLEYFVERLQEKAPNFYEYMSTANSIPENFKTNDDFELSIKAKDTQLDESGYINVEGNLESIFNKTDAYMGLETAIEAYNVEFDKETAKKEQIDVTLDMYFKDNNMIMKTNLLELMDSDELEYNGKTYSIKKDGIVIDLSQLGVEGVSTFEDIMNLTKTSYDIDEISNLINQELYNVDVTVQDAKDIITMYDIMLDLVTDDKFVKKELSNQTMYTWTIDKADIVALVIKVLTTGSEITEEINAEYVKVLNDLVKDFEMVTKLYVKDNVPVKAILDFNFEIAEDEIAFDMEMNWNEEVTNINKGTIKINHPNYENAFDMVKYMQEQEAMYEEAQKRYELSWVQDSVTIYVMNEVANNQGKTVEQVIAEIYNENGWTEDAKEKLDLEDEIDLSKYTLTKNGVVELI